MHDDENIHDGGDDDGDGDGDGTVMHRPWSKTGRGEDGSGRSAILVQWR